MEAKDVIVGLLVTAATALVVVIMYDVVKGSLSSPGPTPTE